MATHEITIPNWRPVTLNTLFSGTLRRRMRLKRLDRELIGVYFRRSDCPKAAKKRRVSLYITLRPRQKEADPDSMWKVLLDSLVKCGALMDDSSAWVELGTVEHARGAKSETVIRLEDLEQ